MAANLLAIAERGPALVHAHNGHLQRDMSSMRMGDLPLEWWSAGAIVSAQLGERYAFLATALGTIRHQGEPFEDVVNHSLMQTLGRSLTTSLTVLLTLFTLWLFGGVTIRNFVLALLIGIGSGTYSSIFNASMLLVVWENGELGRLFGRGGRRMVPARA